jgi:hypothetical protein
MLIDKALNRGYVLSPLAAPHHRREGLVFRWPSNKGKQSSALSRRRSRQQQDEAPMSSPSLRRWWRAAADRRQGMPLRGSLRSALSGHPGLHGSRARSCSEEG